MQTQNIGLWHILQEHHQVKYRFHKSDIEPVISGEWSSEKTIPTSVPRESRTRDRRLSSSTVASITETETSSEQLKPVLDLIDLYYTGQKSLAKSPAVRFHFNPYPMFFGTITERVFWKKIQIHRW